MFRSVTSSFLLTEATIRVWVGWGGGVHHHRTKRDTHMHQTLPTGDTLQRSCQEIFSHNQFRFNNIMVPIHDSKEHFLFTEQRHGGCLIFLAVTTKERKKNKIIMKKKKKAGRGDFQVGMCVCSQRTTAVFFFLLSLGENAVKCFTCQKASMQLASPKVTD